MKAHLEQLKKLVDIPDDYKITFQHKRCNLPSACIYLSRKEIVIIGNKPSLIRYAIFELLMHEIAEETFNKLFPKFEGNSHDDPEFRIIEGDLRDIITDYIAQEHE
jgi:hypothetical protein